MKNVFYEGTTPIITIQIPYEHIVNKIIDVDIHLKQGTTTIVKTLPDCNVDTVCNTLNIMLSADELEVFSASVIDVSCKYQLIGSEQIFAAKPFPIRMKRM